ncbi:Nucleoporin NDC1 [Phlyctochytrium planicorne]|nr:Nucleoporin NDC1 [Phlyctochytrium planicorne]
MPNETFWTPQADPSGFPMAAPAEGPYPPMREPEIYPRGQRQQNAFANVVSQRLSSIQGYLLLTLFAISSILSFPWTASGFFVRPFVIAIVSGILWISSLPLIHLRHKRSQESVQDTILNLFPGFLASGLYLASSLTTAVVYFMFLKNRTNSLGSLFIMPEGKYGPSQLNDRYILVPLFCLILSGSYLTLSNALDRNRINFSTVNSSARYRISRRIPHILSFNLKFALAFTTTFSILYFILRTLLLSSASRFLHVIYNSVTPTPRAYGVLADKKFFLHVSILAFFSLVVWDVIDIMYEAIMAEPVTLPAKVQSNLALYTVYKIARSSPEFRGIIYNADVSDMYISLWGALASECILALNKFSDRLEDLHKKDASKISNSLAKIAERQALLPTKESPKKIDLRNENIMFPKVQPTGVLGAIFAPKEMEDLKKKANLKPLPDKRLGVPTLLRSREVEEKPKAPEPIAKKPPVPQTSFTGLFKQAQDSLQKLVYKRKLEQSSVQTLTKLYFSDFQKVIWASQALSHFLVAATKEDKYGTVQKSVPAILEALLRCIIQVEKYIAKPPGILPSNRRQLQLKIPHCVEDNLQTSIYSIVTALYDYLGRYEFDLKYSEKLHKFLIFRE